MKYCIYCGQQVDEMTGTCRVCSNKNTNYTFNDINKTRKNQTEEPERREEYTGRKEEYAGRKEEYVGSIRKCPACGEIIPALTAICPACGSEINSAKISTALLDFIDKINECDRRIASDPNQPKTGWSTWSNAKRFWWVVLNIYTVCIPLIIYLTRAPLRFNIKPKLTQDEAYKVSLIENFPFPNDRESILEALIFMKSKVAFLESQDINRKSVYWIRLWATKAEQLYQKAEIMFRGDPVANATYKDILIQKNRVMKSVKRKSNIVIAVIVAIVILSLFSEYNSDGTDHRNILKWQSNDLFAYLPEPDYIFGKIVYESEKLVEFEIYQVTSDDFDDYVEECRDEGFNIDVTKTDSAFYANNKKGMLLKISYDSSDRMMEISLNNNTTGDAGAFYEMVSILSNGIE